MRLPLVKWANFLSLAALLGLMPLSAEAATTYKSQKILITVVMLTSTERPTLWGDNNSEQETLLRSQVDIALKSWRNASAGALIFSTRFKISPPIPSLGHCATSQDWKSALSTLNQKAPKLGEKILVINPEDLCTTAGYAQLGGSFASIKNISSTTIAHELGHTFGFMHSATISCPRNDFTALNKSCKVEQYGDKTDLMGSGLAIDSAKMSLAQSFLNWRQPLAKSAKGGKFTLVASSKPLQGTLLSLKTNDGTAYIEFDDGIANGGYKVSELDSPGIEIRIVGSSIGRTYTNAGESGIATLALSRLVGLDGEGNCTAICGLDLRFHQGESVKIPNSRYLIKVLSASTSSAQILISSK